MIDAYLNVFAATFAALAAFNYASTGFFGKKFRFAWMAQFLCALGTEIVLAIDNPVMWSWAALSCWGFVMFLGGGNEVSQK